MLIDPNKPIASFVLHCTICGALVTIGLGFIDLSAAGTTAQECWSGVAPVEGAACWPSLSYLYQALIWFLLIWAALMLPLLAMSLMRRFYGHKMNDWAQKMRDVQREQQRRRDR